MSLPRPYPWQQGQWASLCDLAERQRLPHALLLAGPAETGKRDFALAFAARQLCADPVADGACGRCRQCQLIAAGSHPDLLTVEPAEAGKAIRVDEIRQLGEFASKTASQGGWRIIVLDPAEAMNINAANAFLKTLEEPGRDVLLLLVSHSPGSVLPTIRSRCRILAFALPDRVAGRQWLAQVCGPDSDVDQALAEAGGKPLRARRVLESDLLERYAAFKALVAAVEAGDQSPLQAARQMDILPPLELVEALQRHIHDLLRSPAMLGRPDAELVFRFADKLNQVKMRFGGTANPNPQLVWEEVLMDWKTVVDWQRTKTASSGR